ncbi:MAG: UDP binding domain-containing protein, partial [Desulfatitalea sp.]
ELAEFGISVLVHDPMADAAEAVEHYGITLSPMAQLKGADAIVLAVMHKTYREMGLPGIAALCTNGHPVVVDVKSVFSQDEADRLGINYWRL